MSIAVLLADDHQVVCDGLSVLLNAESDIHVVGQASNGHEAVHSCHGLQPDIVVLDINMPELNGIEATRQILESHSSTGVIILSMYHTSEHIFRSLQAGARGYLLKESAGVEVVDAVRTVHAGRRYFSLKIADEVITDYIRVRQESSEKSPLSQLSSREREVLQFVVEGFSSAEIAGKLSLSTKTVETYRSRMMRKLDIRDIPSLVKFAIQHGLTSLQ